MLGTSTEEARSINFSIRTQHFYNVFSSNGHVRELALGIANEVDVVGDWTSVQSRQHIKRRLGSRSSLCNIEMMKRWLVGILRHCHCQMCRRHKSRDEIAIDEMLDEPEDRRTLSPNALALHQLLSKLGERHRLPVVLFYFQDLSYREISEALKLPIGTVMSRLARARQQLHTLMKAPTNWLC